MNKSRQLTGLLFLGVTAILIGITFFLFLYQEADAPVTVHENTLAVPLATSSATQVGDIVIETPPAVNSVVQRVETSAEGIKREVRNEVLVKTWRHNSGASISLYEKDYFYGDFYEDGPVKQVTLKTGSQGEDLQNLVSNISDEGVILSSSLEIEGFSPRGTYLVVKTIGMKVFGGYQVYNLHTNEEVSFLEDVEFPLTYAKPFWNEDESKLVIINTSSGFDGTPAALFHSSTGQFDNLLMISPFPTENYSDIQIYETTVSGEQLNAKTVLYDERGSSVYGVLQIDMRTGSYTATPEIEW